jgi:hypothetical protein
MSRSICAAKALDATSKSSSSSSQKRARSCPCLPMPHARSIADQGAESAREGRVVLRVDDDHGIPIVHQVAAIERLRGDLGGADETRP